MNTNEFKTKSIIVHGLIPSNPDRWVLALDIGYSAVKGMSPNKYFCFPSYARRISEDEASIREDMSTDIRYREEEDGEVWSVGSLAYDKVVDADVMDSEASLYGRNRYFSDLFRVISRTGMALGLLGNPYGAPGDRKVILQTGLPPRYMKDADDLKDALSGHHEFELKLGSGAWQKFAFDLNSNDIYVMPQPLGSFVSVSVGRDGKPVAQSKLYRSKNLLIFDPGFGTTDVYSFKRGTVSGTETFPNRGMREIFQRTVKDIHKEYGLDLQVATLQNYLESGIVRSRKRIKVNGRPSRQSYSFDLLLEKNCREVFKTLMNELESAYNDFMDYDFIIATGGTYEAWASYFEEELSNMDDLKIIPGNVNVPEIPLIFSNVRGYYFYLNNSRLTS